MAGLAHGTYFMPQIGQQVLVAFNNGDPGEPYVIGALWNAIERPPILLQTDAVNKRIIRTPLGHTVEFDDVTQTLEITSTTLQKITMSPASIELKAGLGAASIQITTAGAVSIISSTSIALSAPKITISGAASVDVTAGASAVLNGGASCTVQGAVVRIN
jgi:phage baseplate assembly protein gpV